MAARIARRALLKGGVAGVGVAAAAVTASAK